MVAPRLCPECGRVMERNLEDNVWECVHCGYEEPLYYGRSDDY